MTQDTKHFTCDDFSRVDLRPKPSCLLFTSFALDFVFHKLKGGGHDNSTMGLRLVILSIYHTVPFLQVHVITNYADIDPYGGPPTSYGGTSPLGLNFEFHAYGLPTNSIVIYFRCL